MKVLNLYAGIGGNRKLWENVNVTAVELDPKIAAVYKKLYPNDEIICDDAHNFLLKNINNYDFIWSSPPCQSHSKMALANKRTPPKYPEMDLYQQIIFLNHYCKNSWVVENVKPYYQPLISPTKIIGRHYFWSNFNIKASDISRPDNFINLQNSTGKKLLQDWLGIHFSETLYYGKNHDPSQVLRNCVHPKLGKEIFNSYLNKNMPNQLQIKLG